MDIENKESKKKIITIASDKGGVGKSTLAALIIEYLNFNNISVGLVDADPIVTSTIWVNNCLENGRNVLSDNPEYLIIDTAGTIGAGLNWINKATVIIVPFKPHYADINTVWNWFESIGSHLRQKVIFVPNQYQKTNEQKECILRIKTAIDDMGYGYLLPSCISNRPAIYGPLFLGSDTNFFAKNTDENVLNEIENLIKCVLKNERI
jgi:cellulose biosynthesis protein BcsQ